jgi:MFS family permease
VGDIEMKPTNLWTKDFTIVTFVNFFVSLTFYLLMVVMSVYAMDSFNSSPSAAGLAASIYVIGASIARFFTGSWIERIGRKKMLYLGLVVNVILTLFYFGISSIWALYLIRFIHGAAFGISSTALGTIVANIIPKERSGEGIGYYGLSVTLATAIGPFIGMLISHSGSYRLIFAACTLSTTISLVTALFLTVPEIKLTQKQLEDLKGFKLVNFFEVKVIPISIVCAVLYLCYSSVLSFLTPYSKEINLVESASFFFIVYAVVIFISRPLTGRLFDAKGENVIMYPAILILMIGMVFLSQTHQGATLLLAAAFLGLGFGAVQSGGQAITVIITEPHRLGLANSTFFICVDFMVGIGPLLFGLFIPYSGYRGMYMGIAIVAFISLFLYYFLHGKKATHPNRALSSSTVNNFAK